MNELINRLMNERDMILEKILTREYENTAGDTMFLNEMHEQMASIDAKIAKLTKGKMYIPEEWK